MDLLISDANIFIDFEDGGLLTRLFEISATIAVPDILFEDELREQHEDLLECGLVLIALETSAVERTVALAARYRQPSRLDLAALSFGQRGYSSHERYHQTLRPTAMKRCQRSKLAGVFHTSRSQYAATKDIVG